MDSKYQYTHGWFLGAEIKTNLFNHLWKDGQNNILEIGSYEGLSSCWFSDNLLNNQYSTLTCVDSWDLHDPITPLSNQTEARFFANLPKSAHPGKCTIYKTTSDDFFEKLAPVARYNLIYVDGSHELFNIKRDIENSWKALAPGGIMWMDDYLGGADQITMKKCMDATLAQFAGQFDVIHQGYQLAIRKRYF